MAEFVISGSGSKSRGKSSNGEKNIKSKGVTSEFFSSSYGFVGFELEGDEVKVTYVDNYGRDIYSFIKKNPRTSATDAIGR